MTPYPQTPLDLPCPKCGAEIGIACHSRKLKLHPARVQRLERAQYIYALYELAFIQAGRVAPPEVD